MAYTGASNASARKGLRVRIPLPAPSDEWFHHSSAPDDNGWRAVMDRASVHDDAADNDPRTGR